MKLISEPGVNTHDNMSAKVYDEDHNTFIEIDCWEDQEESWMHLDTGIYLERGCDPVVKDGDVNGVIPYLKGMTEALELGALTVRIAMQWLKDMELYPSITEINDDGDYNVQLEFEFRQRILLN